MPKKQSNTQKLLAICEARCAALGYELCDAGFEKEPSGLYLRVYIDKEGGVTLDDCERAHRDLQPLLDAFDYDFMEVCSPGIDRPLKREKDIEKNLGNQVEVRLYKAQERQKTFSGALVAMNKEEVRISDHGTEFTFPAANVAQVRLVPDLSGLEDEGAEGALVLEEEVLGAEEGFTETDLGDNENGAEE